MTYVELQSVSDGNINGINLIKIRWFNQKKTEIAAADFVNTTNLCVYT